MAARLLPVLLMALAGCGGGCPGSTGRPAAAGPGDGGARAGARLEGGAEVGLAPVEGGALRMHVEAEPPTLNPLVEHDAWTSWIGLGAIYEPLLRLDAAGGALLPALATEVRPEGDRALRVLLRPGVLWHDGAPFTADDVVATLALRDLAGAAPDLRAQLDAIAAVERVAERELVIRLARPSPLLPYALSRVPILPRHRFAPGDLRTQEVSRAPVGTGPFRFVEWRAGERIVLERWPSYWGPRPHLDRVELRIVPDREVALQLARRGELDLMWQLSPAQVDRALDDPALGGFRIVPAVLPRYAFVVWNQRRPPLGDRRVRQALTALVDRARYRQLVYRGRARPMSGPYLPGSPSADPTVGEWPFDPARAASLLDQAGLRDTDGDGVRELDGQPLRLALLLSPPDSPTLGPLATMMQEDLRRAGVQLDIVPVAWAAFLQRLRSHAFDAAALMWNNVEPWPDNWALFHSSQAADAQNYGGWKSPEADRLLDAIRGTPPGAERAALDHAFHRLVHQEQPYTFLASPEVDSLVAPRVHGYRPDGDGPGFPRLWVSGPAGAGR